MKNKLLSLMLYIFTFLFLLFPTSYGISDLKVLIFFAIILLLILFLYKKVKIFKKIHINNKLYPWIILLLALISRVMIVFLFNTHIEQVSDFARALNVSNTLDFSNEYYRVFTHWILYPVMIHGVYMIFGSSQLVALLVNAILLTIAALLVYKVSSLLFKNKTFGFVSALIYIFWPSSILYTLIFTQEHICSVLLLFVLYLFLKLEDNSNLKLNKGKIIALIGIGICLGLSNFFKNFAPVFLIAFVIYYFLVAFKEKNIKKYTVVKLISIGLIVICFSLTKSIVFLEIDNLVGGKVARNIIPCYLNVGLSNDGTYDYDTYYEYINAFIDNNYDYDKANDEIMNIVKSDILDGTSAIYNEDFFDNKARIIVGNDQSKIILVISSINAKDSMAINNFIENQYMDFNDYYYIVLIALMALGLVIMNKNKDLKLFLLYLVLFGSLLLLLLIEAQNRYTYAIQPLLCILATGGLFYLIKLLRRKDNDKILEVNKS